MPSGVPCRLCWVAGSAGLSADCSCTAYCCNCTNTPVELSTVGSAFSNLTSSTQHYLEACINGERYRPTSVWQSTAWERNASWDASTTICNWPTHKGSYLLVDVSDCSQQHLQHPPAERGTTAAAEAAVGSTDHNTVAKSGVLLLNAQTHCTRHVVELFSIYTSTLSSRIT